jgi:hypothetical protein
LCYTLFFPRIKLQLSLDSRTGLSSLVVGQPKEQMPVSRAGNWHSPELSEMHEIDLTVKVSTWPRALSHPSIVRPSCDGDLERRALTRDTCHR